MFDHKSIHGTLSYVTYVRDVCLCLYLYLYTYIYIDIYIYNHRIESRSNQAEPSCLGGVLGKRRGFPLP